MDKHILTKKEICVFVLVNLFFISLVIVSYNYKIKMEKEYEEKLILYEQLLIEVEEKEALQPQLEELTKQADEITAHYEKLYSIAQMSDKDILITCEEILNGLYQEKNSVISQTKIYIADSYSKAYEAITGAKVDFTVEQKDYLAAVISEITGSNGIGSAVSEVVNGIQDGESVDSVLNDVLSVVGDTASATIQEKIVDTVLESIFTEKISDVVSASSDIFSFSESVLGEKKEAKLQMIQAVTKNYNYYLWEIDYFLSLEELSTKDYVRLQGDLDQLNTIFLTVELLSSNTVDYPDLENICDSLKECQNVKSQLEQEIQFYERIIEVTNEKNES